MRDAEWRPLRRVNPLTKLAVAVLFVIVVTVIFDLRFQVIVLAQMAIVLLVLEGVPPLRLLFVVLPFALMGFGFLWSHLLFHQAAGGYVDSLGRFSLLRGAAFDDGMIVFLRAINFGVVSYAFVRATPPAALGRALMQNAGLRPTIAFAVSSVVQFIPQLQDELRQLRMAHRLRGAAKISRLRAFASAPRRYVGMIIPLLVGAVRRAQRSAISMEARGLTHPMQRTYLVGSHFGPADVTFTLVSVIVLGATIGAVAL
jgi:energy-coupling factor transport system permease protein